MKLGELKRHLAELVIEGSIHPQGWVPVETSRCQYLRSRLDGVAFTPKGGCPLKPGSDGRGFGFL